MQGPPVINTENSRGTDNPLQYSDPVNFYVKGKIGNIISFKGYTVSVAMT